MGNTCCRDRQYGLQGYENSSDDNDIKKQKKSYFHKNGVPYSNAYKTYVKAPTTVGRQTYIVQNLQSNNQIPDWIWDFDDNMLKSTKARNKQNNNNNPFFKNDKNRNTYKQLVRMPIQQDQTLVSQLRQYDNRIKLKPTISNQQQPSVQKSQIKNALNMPLKSLSSLQDNIQSNNQQIKNKNLGINNNLNNLGLKRTDSTNINQQNQQDKHMNKNSLRITPRHSNTTIQSNVLQNNYQYQQNLQNLQGNMINRSNNLMYDNRMINNQSGMSNSIHNQQIYSSSNNMKNLADQYASSIYAHVNSLSGINKHQQYEQYRYRR